MQIGEAPELRHRRTSSDYIADALRDAINGGQLEDGAVLNQVELAEHFGVSRVPVREAIRRLEAEGLVEAAAHRRAVVRGLSLDRIAEVYELRALLEGHLTEQAVPNFDRADVERLNELNRQLREERDHARWLELNAAFHETLYAPAGRPTALELVDSLRQRGERYVQMWSGGRGLERTSQVAKEHTAIVRCVRRGDAAGARDAIVAHIEHTRDAVLKLHRAAAGNGDGSR
ncbi:GntR family transcriptional regulator [Conexibacter arvalis]|uniref:GntR family transcriptional regulator n=1 Tax=Conexibacter arvalis TaxID=912552 RepID=UPI00160BF193|nr:GntR family transcriptional regulator [Conexibacter arvalis]